MLASHKPSTIEGVVFRIAWVLGAVDPVSGTVAVHELVRGLGALLKEGWKPLRTIVIASWDAEEVGKLLTVYRRLLISRNTVWPHWQHRVGRRFSRMDSETRRCLRKPRFLGVRLEIWRRRFAFAGALHS